MSTAIFPVQQPLKQKGQFPLYARSVTLCLAAHCLDGEAPCIVLVADRRFDYGPGLGAHDRSWKFRLAGPGWGALIAGDRVDHCDQLLTHYRASLDGKGPLVDNVSLLPFMEAPLEAYSKWLQKKDPHDHTTSELLLTGFLANGEPRIFQVTASVDRQSVVAVDTVGRIGSGCFLAHYALQFRRYTRTTPLVDALYYLYEAKRWAELDTGVGPETMICVQDPSPTHDAVVLRYVSAEGLDLLRDQFEAFGPQPFERGSVTLHDLLEPNRKE